MKFIRKTVMAMSKVHIDSSVQFSEETFPWGRQEAERRVHQQVQFYFTLAFGYHPHPSWVTATEDLFLEDTRVQLLTIRAALPLKGDQVMIDDRQIQLGFTVTERTRLPVLKHTMGWDPNETYPTPANSRTDVYQHTGWDADSGLMVFEERS